MRNRRLQHFAAILLAASVSGGPLAVPASAQAREAAVGAEGELYRIREGTYGALFPQWGLADPHNRVLALEIVQSDGDRELLLVPGTETADVEDSASILLEDQSGTLFVLWQTMIRAIHSRLVLMGFHGGEWSEPIEISGSAFGWKSSPQLAVTKDTYGLVTEDGRVRRLTRTVVHLLWWEDGPSGVPETFYTPVVFLDGLYTGWNPVYRLDELAQVAGGQPPVATNLALGEAPRIEAGRNEQSVVVGFVDGSGGWLSSLEIELLPGEIAFIADRIRAQITDLGRELPPEEPTALASKIRAQITDLGTRLGLHPGLTAYLAKSVHDEALVSDPQEPVAVLADRIRAQITDLGARMTDRGFDRLGAKSSSQVVEFPKGDTESELVAPPNLIRLTLAAVRPAPATGEGEHSVFLSRDGRQVVVSWHEEGVVYYRESRGQGWSELRRLSLGTELDLARAHEILAQRADERNDE